MAIAMRFATSTVIVMVLYDGMRVSPVCFVCGPLPVVVCGCACPACLSSGWCLPLVCVCVWLVGRRRVACGLCVFPGVRVCVVRLCVYSMCAPMCCGRYWVWVFAVGARLAGGRLAGRRRVACLQRTVACNCGRPSFLSCMHGNAGKAGHHLAMPLFNGIRQRGLSLSVPA